MNDVEMWDILDANGVKTGRLHRPGEKMNDGEYHLIVQVWIQNRNGAFIITKRSPQTFMPNLWECTGGSAFAGEDSLTAALREAKEETGLMLNADKGEIIHSCRFDGKMYNGFLDVWLFCEDVALDDAILQAGETCDIKWATKDEILKLIEKGEFIDFGWMEYVHDMFQKF